MRVLWQMFDKCLVAAHVLQMLLVKVADHIEQRKEVWGDTELEKHHAIVMRTEKGHAMRTDPDLKDAVMQRWVQDNRASSSAQGLRAAGLNFGKTIAQSWLNENCTGLISAARLSFSQPQTVSMILDGGAIGKPAKGYMIGGQWHYPRCLASVFAPQEPCGVFVVSTFIVSIASSVRSPV